MSSELPFLVLALPTVAFVLLALIAPLRRSGLPAAYLVIGASAASLWAAIKLLVNQLSIGDAVQAEYLVRWLPNGGESLADVGWIIDGTSAPMLVVVGFVALCVQVYSLGYLDEESPAGLGRYFTWHALFVFSMQSLVLAPNLLQLFMGWELVGLCSYLLIGFWWQKPEAARASVKAFWVTKAADGGLLLGLIVLMSATGGTNWDPTGISENTINLITMLLFLGVMGKSAQMPLHIWLPDAMQGPTPVSALLHAATMVAAGVFLVVRGWPLFEASEITLTVMLWVGSITAFAAAIFALLQDDVKKMLAFSTCSQLGYMIAALGAGGMAAGYFHLTTHAFFKALLFLGAGSLIHAMGTNSMSKMGGLARKMPLTFLLFTLGSLALAGIFPFAGFYSKDLVLESLEHGHHMGPLILAMGGVAITATYVGKSLTLIFFGETRSPEAHPHEGPITMLVPMALLGSLTVGAGFMLLKPFQGLLGNSEAVFHFTTLGYVGLGLAICGLGVGNWLAKGGTIVALRPIGTLILSSPLDRLYLKLWRGVLLSGGKFMAWIDRYVVDGAMNGVGLLFVVLGERARKAQTSRVDDYAATVVAGAMVICLSSIVLWTLFVGAV